MTARNASAQISWPLLTTTRLVTVYRGFQPPLTFDQGFEEGFAAGTATIDSLPPTVEIVSPTPGVVPGDPGGFPLSFQSARNIPIVLRVTDDTGLRSVVVTASFRNYPAPGKSVVEVVYRRGVFVGNYLSLSYEVAVAGGVELHCRRDDGWPVGTGAPGDVKFSVDAVDVGGNLT